MIGTAVSRLGPTVHEIRGSVSLSSSVSVVSRRLPLIAAAAWWAVCFALYATAWPIAYTHRNILGVSALMAGTLICAIVGYHVGFGGQHLAPQTARWNVPASVLVGFV